MFWLVVARGKSWWLVVARVACGVRSLDSVVDFGKHLFKSIRGFNAALRLSELIVNPK